MQEYQLEQNIAGINFSKLIDLCFSYASYFSLTGFVYNTSVIVESSEIYKCLLPYMCESILTEHWFRNYVVEPNRLNVFIYKIDHFSKKKQLEIIKNYISDLYMDNLFEYDSQTRSASLEDLCFFSGNRLFLGTVSHEGLCSLFPNNNEMKSGFFKLGKWQKTEYDEEEHIRIW